MGMHEQLVEICEKIYKLHPNDPIISQYWDQLTEILSRSEDETVAYFNDANDKKMIYTVCSVFADVAYELQSQRFIDCIEDVQKRNPDLNLERFIERAKDNMLGD